MDVAMGNYDAGVRKAAILVASLDAAAADVLFDRLDPARAELVRRAAAAIGEIDPEEQQRVIDEFCRIGPMIPKACTAGIELSSLSVSPLPMRAGEEAVSTRRRPHPDPLPARTGGWPGEATAHFDFLGEADEAGLARLLAEERPATVALVLSHLPPEQGGEVLARLAPALQIEVVRRLVDAEDADPQTVCEVRRALESRLSEQLDADRRGAAAPESAAKILAACASPIRGRILDNLAAEDQPLAERLGRHAMGFDDLVRCDDSTLRGVLAAAGLEVVQAALLGAAPGVSARLLKCLPAKEAKTLRRKLAHPDPIRLSEVEDARRQIAALAQQLSYSGPQRTAA
jgi:flagellar motor switch protein FliG